MDEWKAVGGDWTIANGVIYNNSNERGSKLLWTDRIWKGFVRRRKCSVGCGWQLKHFRV